VTRTGAPLERIEWAERHTPFCWCGAPTLPVECRGAIRLRCSSLDRSQGIVRRLLSFGLSHTDQPILDLSESEAAT
jgi:hypothetical protein